MTLNQYQQEKKWVEKIITSESCKDLKPFELVEKVYNEDSLEDLPKPFTSWDDPYLLGLIHERAVSIENRNSRGAWYTPRSIVKGIVKLSLDSFDGLPEILIDPTCGGGAFLLASLDELVSRGHSPETSLSVIRGMDIDPEAIEVTRLAINSWARNKGINKDFKKQFICLDSLQEIPEDWKKIRVVVGNPPFGSPLKESTFNGVATDFHRDNSEYFGQYSDLAALHFLKAYMDSELGSVISMVLPHSVLSSNDVAEMRKYLLKGSSMPGFWISKDMEFDASVRTLAPIIKKGGKSIETSMFEGKNFKFVGKTELKTWRDVALLSFESPSHSLDFSSGKFGDLANVTAGFRDEYYGLVSACQEWSGELNDAYNKFLTVGSVDSLWTFWGTKPIKYAKEKWEAPWINEDIDLPNKITNWINRQKKPKILLATQAKILEPFVDTEGNYIATTPLLIIEPKNFSIEHLAVIFLAPPIVLFAWRQTFGSAMSVESIKLSAKQVMDLPLPAEKELWDEAADLLKSDYKQIVNFEDSRKLSMKIAEIMNVSYGGSQETFNWWTNRFGFK